MCQYDHFLLVDGVVKEVDKGGEDAEKFGGMNIPVGIGEEFGRTWMETPILLKSQEFRLRMILFPTFRNGLQLVAEPAGKFAFKFGSIGYGGKFLYIVDYGMSQFGEHGSLRTP